MSLSGMTRPVGPRGLCLPVLGMGAAPLGLLFEPVTDGQAEATVAAALGRGIRYFDTAPSYGLGASERRLGAVLGSRDRDGFVVSTKVGTLLRRGGRDHLERASVGLDPGVTAVGDWTGEGIRRSIEDSLERLGLERIDIAYLHDPDEHLDEVRRSAYPALARLRDEGAVAAIGVGTNHADVAARFVRELDLDVVLLARRYTLLDQSAQADFLPACEETGTAVVVAGVMRILLPPARPGADSHYPHVPQEVLGKARRIEDVCRAHGVGLAAAAMRFPLGHPAVATVLVGMRSPEEVTDNVEAFGAEIPPALWDDLRGAGLLDPSIPQPPG